MGIKERKEREKRRRSNAILRAARRIVREKGVEGMTMNRVAELTELNKATLYSYFSNKDDLIDAIVYEGLTTLEKLFQEVVSQPLNGLEKVMRLVQTMYGFYKKYPVYFYTMNHQERRTPKERTETPYAIKGNKKASGLFQTMTECIDQGIKEGNIRENIDTKSFLMLFFAQIYGVMHTIHDKEDVYVDVLELKTEDIEKSGLEMIEYYLKNSK